MATQNQHLIDLYRQQMFEIAPYDKAAHKDCEAIGEAAGWIAAELRTVRPREIDPMQAIDLAIEYVHNPEE